MPKGPIMVTLLTTLALASVAYAGRTTRGEHRTACQLGLHYSSFYNGCTRSWAPREAANRDTAMGKPLAATPAHAAQSMTGVPPVTAQADHPAH